ncbi:hypothetical protein ES708_21860 [subsurface metagenome]
MNFSGILPDFSKRPGFLAPSVVIAPGAIAFTRILSLINSIAIPFVKEIIAAFDAA